VSGETKTIDLMAALTKSLREEAERRKAEALAENWLELTLEDRITPAVIQVRVRVSSETGEGVVMEGLGKGMWASRGQGSRLYPLALGALLSRLREVEAERDRMRERIKSAADGHRDLAQAARKAGERDDAMLHAHMAAAVRELLSESEEG
jgi:hypothetical protein